MSETTTYITFGYKWGLPGNQRGKDVHPSGYPVSCDGWCEITGCTREQARQIAVAVFGRDWASDYGYPPEKWCCPAGCQLRVRAEEVHGELRWTVEEVGGDE